MEKPAGPKPVWLSRKQIPRLQQYDSHDQRKPILERGIRLGLRNQEKVSEGRYVIGGQDTHKFGD